MPPYYIRYVIPEAGPDARELLRIKKLTTEIEASQDAVEQRTEAKASRTDSDSPASAPTGRAGGGGRGRR